MIHLRSEMEGQPIPCSSAHAFWLMKLDDL